MAKNKEKPKESSRGNDFNSFLKLFISVLIIVVATEIFGTKTFKICLLYTSPSPRD